MKKTARSTKSVLIKAGIGLLAAVLFYIVLSLILSPIIYRTVFSSITKDFTYEYVYDDIAADYPRSLCRFDSNGVSLCGYDYHTAHPRATVVISNGIGSTCDAHLAEIMYFLDHGFDVFTYDGTGVGRSDGNSIIGLSQMPIDLLAAIRFLRARSDAPLLLYGHSAGGYAAAAVSDADGVAAVVSIAAYNSPVDTMYSMAHRYAGLIADTGMPFLTMEHRRTFGDDGFIDAIDVINRTRTPIAVYYGDHDTTIVPAVSLYTRNEESVNPNASFFLVDGGHSDIWLTERARAYQTKKRAEYAALTEQYGKDLPSEILTDFAAGIDYPLANELDEDFMAQVTAFFSRAIS